MPVQNCSLCWHSRRPQIERYMKADANYNIILRYLREAAKEDPKVRTYGTKDPLKRHRERCLGLPPLASMTGGRDLAAPPPPPADEGEVTDKEIRDEARRLLHARLGELGAKELHTLVVEGLKTERALAAAKRKDAEDDDSDEDAIEDMRGALGQLKVV